MCIRDRPTTVDGHTYDCRYARYWHHGGRYLPHRMRAPTGWRIAATAPGRPGPAILMAATWTRRCETKPRRCRPWRRCAGRPRPQRSAPGEPGGPAVGGSACGSGADREPDLEACAALRTVGRRDRSAMRFHDPRRDRQPQAGAAGRRVVGAPEAFEDSWQVFVADARALVVDGQHRIGPFGANANGDGRPGRAVGQGVVGEDRHELAKPERISGNLRGPRIDPVSYTHLTLPTILRV